LLYNNNKMHITRKIFIYYQFITYVWCITTWCSPRVSADENSGEGTALIFINNQTLLLTNLTQIAILFYFSQIHQKLFQLNKVLRLFFLCKLNIHNPDK
jgi:hypothetical protein